MSSEPRTDVGVYGVVAGSALSITLTSVDNNNNPYPLTGYATTWTSHLRPSPLGSPTINFTVDSSKAAQGILVLSLTGTITNTMDLTTEGVANWYFDVQGTGGSVSPQTPFRGRVDVYQPYTP